MEGQKINDAKKAVLDLLRTLSPGDRFGLITYADHVQRHSGMLSVTGGNREHLESMIRNISPGGSTNLGAGLQEGISLLEKLIADIESGELVC